MWYVIQVRSGHEENIAMQCRKTITETDGGEAVLQECFIPYAKRQRRYGGRWHMEQRVLFPGYVFLVSSQPDELFLSLKHVLGLTKILGTGQEIVPLHDEEVQLLQKLGGSGHVVEVSTGFVEGDHVTVTDGPLQGMEGFVTRIDRHKRVAWIGIAMMGRMVETQVGLEVVDKYGAGENSVVGQKSMTA